MRTQEDKKLHESHTDLVLKNIPKYGLISLTQLLKMVQTRNMTARITEARKQLEASKENIICIKTRKFGICTETYYTRVDSNLLDSVTTFEEKDVPKEILALTGSPGDYKRPQFLHYLLGK